MCRRQESSKIALYQLIKYDNISNIIINDEIQSKSIKICK